MRDYERATLAANKCLAISPGAASCLRRRADVEAARGEVAKLEEDARSMIAVESDSPLAYEFLAEALESRAAPVEGVVHALQLRQAVVFGMHAIFAGFLDPTVAPAWLSGDFEGVIARFPDWEKVRLTTTSDRIASDVTRSRSSSSPKPDSPSGRSRSRTITRGDFRRSRRTIRRTRDRAFWPCVAGSGASRAPSFAPSAKPG